MSDDFLRYSQALDEIWRLRRILAHEACVLEAHLGLKTFPKSRRAYAELQVERMRASARGEAKEIHQDMDFRKLNHAMAVAGANSTLTGPEFQAESERRASVYSIGGVGGESGVQ